GKRQAIDGFLAAFEPRQVSANKRVAQGVADGGKDLRRRCPGKVSGKWNESAELVARVVLEKACRRADQRLPEELERIILFNIFREVEDPQVAEEGLGVTRQLSFLRIDFQDEIEPALLEIEFTVGHRQIVDLGHIETEQSCGGVKSRTVGEWV